METALKMLELDDILICQKNLPSSACTAHESTILYRFPLLSGSPSPPPLIPSLPDLAHQDQSGPSNPYLALPPPEDEIPDLDELPSEQPPSPPPTTPAPTMSGHHHITLAADPPYFDGDKTKYMGFVDLCTAYIGVYRSEFSTDETKILFILSYLCNEAGTSCAASRWAMNWKQHNYQAERKRHSMDVYVQITGLDSGKTRGVKALLDSGCSTCCIDTDYARAEKLDIQELPQPIVAR
ncbi:unnamed protein product [Mycena citricolor]|uniref:Uncharacterized protein n=1 Tax=Mycena citricolor TaxID=2018698 RepID=A0AAD2H938_9AGAR|nr:unnamed protein product [Mycena citricolor]